MREFCTALAGVADEFNCPCIDGYKALGINTANASAFLADGAHLNEHGRKVFGEYIGGCLIAPSGTEPQEMPTTLPNPNPLTFTGAVTGSYDGSAPLSVEIPSGGSGAYPVLDMTADTAELAPNTYYKWGEIAALTITLGAEIAGITNEYCFEFISGATATELTVPNDIKWAQEPSIEAGKTYQVSILNKIGVIVGA